MGKAPSRFINLFSLGVGISLSVASFLGEVQAHQSDTQPKRESLYYVRIKAANRLERTRVASSGVSIDRVMSDSVYGTVPESIFNRMKSRNAPIMESFKIKQTRNTEDFPSDDSAFHNYKEMTEALDKIVTEHSNIMKKFSLGKSLFGLEIWGIQINSSPAALHADGNTTFSAKPGVVFMGNHHAREHLSAEIPLMLLEFIAKNYGTDRAITDLVDKRDIYIIPMVNPDGVEFDIASGSYRWQRKNLRKNKDGSLGVDLNRNYGYKWGGGGASPEPGSETYRGPAPFSEPETQAVRAFILSHPNINVLLSYHTFSELILYPWGYTYDHIEERDDYAAYDTMAKTMAKWNGYTPQQASQLYIASGDTTDWAYGDRSNGKQKIFAFTFELSPKDMWHGGFYPGAKIIDYVFQANLKPALYLIELADNPYRSIGKETDYRLSWLK